VLATAALGNTPANGATVKPGFRSSFER